MTFVLFVSHKVLDWFENNDQLEDEESSKASLDALAKTSSGVKGYAGKDLVNRILANVLRLFLPRDKDDSAQVTRRRRAAAEEKVIQSKTVEEVRKHWSRKRILVWIVRDVSIFL